MPSVFTTNTPFPENLMIILTSREKYEGMQSQMSMGMNLSIGPSENASKWM